MFFLYFLIVYLFVWEEFGAVLLDGFWWLVPWVELGYDAGRAARWLIPLSGRPFVSSAALLQRAVASPWWPSQTPAVSGALGEPDSKPPGESGPRGCWEWGHSRLSHRGREEYPLWPCPGVLRGAPRLPGPDRGSTLAAAEQGSVPRGAPRSPAAGERLAAGSALCAHIAAPRGMPPTSSSCGGGTRPRADFLGA